MVSVTYNDELDILMVEKEDYSNYSNTIELGGYVLDLDTDNDFLGLEIIDASQNTPFDKSELSQISDVDATLVKTDEYIRIELRFMIDNHQNMITSQYPAVSPA